MKRFVFGVIALLLLGVPFSVSAQRNTVTGAMIIHNTDVIRSKKAKSPKKQFAVADINKGYQQEVSFAYSLMFDTGSMINLNYVGGYRFNHHFYVGLGTGLDFSTNNDKGFVCYGEMKYIDGYRYIPYHYMDGLYSAELKIGKRYLDSYWGLPMQTVAVPLYVHLRTYFMKTKWTPFLAFSAGVRLSSSKKLDVYDVRIDKGSDIWSSWYYYVGDYSRTIEYGAVTGMFEVMPGVSYQHKSGTAFNFQFGFATRSGDYDILGNYDIEHCWDFGFTMRLGVVF
ncbi:MAG: hypothetical protein IKA07_02495 [Alistipes sp.]|nr:hypothetical protein [Alistipes sp.]